MKRRTTIVSLILGLCVISAAPAQGQREGGPGGRRMEMMFKDITLTQIQKNKVDSLVAHYREQMGPMTPGTRPDSATMAARRRLMQKQAADLRAILTPAQQPVFDRNLEEMRAAMEQRQRGQ